jgi:hypothetical protein
MSSIGASSQLHAGSRSTLDANLPRPSAQSNNQQARTNKPTIAKHLFRAAFRAYTPRLREDESEQKGK